MRPKDSDLLISALVKYMYLAVKRIIGAIIISRFFGARRCQSQARPSADCGHEKLNFVFAASSKLDFITHLLPLS